MARPGSIEHARNVRAHRARALRRLEKGEDSLRDALVKPPDKLLGVSVYLLLSSPPRMGPRTARTICEKHTIWPLTPLCRLTPRQRKLIIEELDERN